MKRELAHAKRKLESVVGTLENLEQWKRDVQEGKVVRDTQDDGFGNIEAEILRNENYVRKYQKIVMDLEKNVQEEAQQLAKRPKVSGLCEDMLHVVMDFLPITEICSTIVVLSKKWHQHAKKEITKRCTDLYLRLDGVCCCGPRSIVPEPHSRPTVEPPGVIQVIQKRYVPEFKGSRWIGSVPTWGRYCLGCKLSVKSLYSSKMVVVKSGEEALKRIKMDYMKQYTEGYAKKTQLNEMALYLKQKGVLHWIFYHDEL